MQPRAPARGRPWRSVQRDIYHSIWVVLWLACCYTFKFPILVTSLSQASISGLVTENVGRSVCLSVCMSVCLSVCKVYCGKTAEWTRMPFGMVSGVGRGMCVLDWMVIVELEETDLGLYLGHPIVPKGDFATWLFPNYFGRYLFIKRCF